MYEHILARGTLDESVPLGSVKPLHCTFLSHDLLLSPGLLGINPCFADVPSSTLRSRGSEDVTTLPGNKGCGSARSSSAKEKGPRMRSDGLMRVRQSRSLEPMQCVHSTADRNINPNPRFGSTESSSLPNKGEQKMIAGTLHSGKRFYHKRFQISNMEHPRRPPSANSNHQKLCYDKAMSSNSESTTEDRKARLGTGAQSSAVATATVAKPSDTKELPDTSLSPGT